MTPAPSRLKTRQNDKNNPMKSVKGSYKVGAAIIYVIAEL